MIKLDTSGKRIYYSLNYDCTEAFVEKLQQLLSRKNNCARQTLHRNGELYEPNEYFFSRIIVFIAAVCSLVCGCTSGGAQETPLPKNTPQITPAPVPTEAVSEFPTCTAPAITDAPNHDTDSETVLTAEQISVMNAAFLQFPGESAGLFDLASFKNGISAKRLKALIAQGNLPSANGYVGQTPLSAQQRNEILNNRALDAVQGHSDVRFGFCVQRSDLRSVPFAPRVTSKPNDRFGDTLQESVVLQNEPLAVLHESADGKFLFVAAYFMSVG